MDEMRRLRIEPGEGCNVMALKACADAGLWEKTLAMLKDMRASGVNRSERCVRVFRGLLGELVHTLRETETRCRETHSSGIIRKSVGYPTAGG